MQEQKIMEALCDAAEQAWKDIDTPSLDPEQREILKDRATYLTELYFSEDERQNTDPSVDEEDLRYWFLYESGLWKE